MQADAPFLALEPGAAVQCTQVKLGVSYIYIYIYMQYAYDTNLLKLRSLDSSFPFFLSD